MGYGEWKCTHEDDAQPLEAIGLGVIDELRCCTDSTNLSTATEINGKNSVCRRLLLTSQLYCKGNVRRLAPRHAET